jgi:hypothetical protein
MGTWPAVFLGAGVAAALSSAVAGLAARRVLMAMHREAAALAREERATRAEVVRLGAALAGSQAWFWTPEWQDGEREADEDLAAGRATFQFGPAVIEGEPHIIWRRIGTHDIFDRP